MSPEDKYEMKLLLRQWGDNPSRRCPNPPTWPDFPTVMPRPDTPLRRPIEPQTNRPPPLIVTPYQPLGMPRKRRRVCESERGGARGRGRGGARGRGRGARARGSGRGRGGARGSGGARGHGRGRGGSRGRGSGRVIDSSSSEDEFVLTTGHERGCGDARGRGHGTVSDGTSSEDELLSSIQNRFKSERKYPIGTKIRKKFGRKCYNGSIVRLRNDENEHWHVKYSDGDSESLSEEELRSSVEMYNKKYKK